MGTATVGHVGDSGNVLVDSLVWGSRWVSGGTGPTVITVGMSPGATAAEVAAMQKVIANIEAVVNVDIQWMGVDTNRDADIRFVTGNGRAGLLGEGFPPGEFWLEPLWNPGLSEVRVYRNNYSGGLSPGSFDFITFLHEFAHAMGLAHPHDTGGTWLDKSKVLPGVTPGQGFGDFGDFNLNQGIFTTMSYNDGWATGGLGGVQSSLMALDILALQYIYGANTAHAMGDDAYVLPRSGGYSCIWDCGGSDTIRLTSLRGGTVDLRAATGIFGEGAGGYVSYASGCKGGFTIATGVFIENAEGGRGADVLIGNGVANRLTGGMGRDIMTGGDGSDCFVFKLAGESSSLVERADHVTDFSAGDIIDLSLMDAIRFARGVQDFIYLGETEVFTAAGQVRVSHECGATLIHLNTDADQQDEALIILDGDVSLTSTDFIF